VEHGKFSISKIWHIAKMEYIKLIMDPRMILIVAALVFYGSSAAKCGYDGKTNQCV